MPVLENVDALSYEEKLAALEELAISISRQPESNEVPEWHGEILSERHEKIQSGEAKFIPLGEARRRSLSKYQK